MACLTLQGKLPKRLRTLADEVRIGCLLAPRFPKKRGGSGRSQRDVSRNVILRELSIACFDDRPILLHRRSSHVIRSATRHPPRLGLRMPSPPRVKIFPHSIIPRPRIAIPRWIPRYFPANLLRTVRGGELHRHSSRCERSEPTAGGKKKARVQGSGTPHPKNPLSNRSVLS